MAQIFAQRIGFQEAAQNLRELGKNAVEGLREPLEEISFEMMEIEEKIFNSGGRRGGGQWKPVTYRWARRKAKLGGDPRTMHFQRHLRRSLTYSGDPNMLRKINPREGTIIFGSKLPYARSHQKGLHGMPQRVIIKFLRGDRQRFAMRVNRYLKKEWKGRAKKRT